MKKLIAFLTIVIIGCLTANAAVLDYKSAVAKNGTKPMAVLIYANWAEQSTNILNQYKKAERKLANSYNFVELNIADRETKEFNDNYIINSKLPYILLLRSSGKISMIINRDCASSSKCAIDKMKTFLK